MEPGFGALLCRAHCLNLMGIDSEIVSPPNPEGGAGIGLARRSKASASWSNALVPDDPDKRADKTWPLRSIVKVTETVPEPLAPVG